jgi:cellulose biosynthesis protein BcsQ
LSPLSYGKPITHYDLESPGAKAYRELADEVLERLKGDLMEKRRGKLIGLE